MTTHMRTRQEEFSNALSRSLIDVIAHPLTRGEERRARLRALEEAAAQDANDAHRADVLAMRDARERARIQAMAANAAQGDAHEETGAVAEAPRPVSPAGTEAGGVDPFRLIEVSEERYRHLRDHFDLNDDFPEESGVNVDEVVRIVLDEVAETFQGNAQWQEHRATVRRQVAEGQDRRPAPLVQRLMQMLTHTEELWRDVLGNQQHLAWGRSQKAAYLAGELLLVEWEQSGRWARLLEQTGEDAWEFPDRFFGGIYCDSSGMRKLAGCQVKPLYEKHKNVVVAAVAYARAARDELLRWGTRPGDGSDVEEDDEEAVGGGGGRDRARRRGGGARRNAAMLESKADALVLRYFPWVKHWQLGRENNIVSWRQFTRDLNAYAEVYDCLWVNKKVAVDRDGQVYQVSDQFCTWDRITEEMCKYKTTCLMLKAIRAHVDLQKSYKRKQNTDAAEGAGTSDDESGRGGGSSDDTGDGGNDSDDEDEDNDEVPGLLDRTSSGYDSSDDEEEDGEDERSLHDGEDADDDDSSDDDDDDDDGPPPLLDHSSRDNLDSDDEDGEAEGADDFFVDDGAAAPKPIAALHLTDGCKPESHTVARPATCASLRTSTTAGQPADGRMGGAVPPGKVNSWAEGRRTRSQARLQSQRDSNSPSSMETGERPRVETRITTRIEHHVETCREKRVECAAAASPPRGRGSLKKARKQGPVKSVAGKKSTNKKRRRSGGRSAAAKAARPSGTGSRRKKLPPAAGAGRESEPDDEDDDLSDAKPAAVERGSGGHGAANGAENGRDDGGAQGSGSRSVGRGRGRNSHIDAPSFNCEVVAKVPHAYSTTVSAVLPRDGQRFENFAAYETLPRLLNADSCRGKVKWAVSLEKNISGTIYSYDQITTAPHATHPTNQTRGVQGAAVGLPSLSLHGDMSLVNADVTYLPPGTDEYQQLGLDEIFRNIGPPVFKLLLEGLYEYGMRASMTQQKASEHVGKSRNAFNFGIGYAGHAYEPGAQAPADEFAEVHMMNRTALEFFPDQGRCLGTLLEALGSARREILARLLREERTDAERNASYSSNVGALLHRPDCDAGEALFFSLECSRSETMRRVLRRWSKFLNRDVEGGGVHLHVDGQNPPPESDYSRVVLATWSVFLLCEGRHCPMQITAILCDRATIDNRFINNRAVTGFRDIYQLGLQRFATRVGGLAVVQYEEDGLGFLEQSKALLMSYLGDEPAPKNTDGSPGGWFGHIETDEPGQYRLAQGATMRRRLQTVGDAALRDLDEKGMSEMVDIVQGPRSASIPRAMIRALPANPNKMAPHSAERHAAKLVVDRFHLKQQHVWNLMYCKLQHYICSAIFITKCVSLVTQWDDLWADTEWGADWMAACNGDGFDGSLASLFMNMTDAANNNNVAGTLRRVGASHLDKDEKYAPEFCAEQIERLRRFADDVVQSNDNRTTIEILQRAKGRQGPLPGLKNLGDFVYPQLIVGLFLWGLIRIPCWRAAECPILDTGKEHFQRGTEGVSDDAPQQAHLLDTAREEYSVKSVVSVQRVLSILAHEENTSEHKPENTSCEGVRDKNVYDYYIEGMVSFDLRPAPGSNHYHKNYRLWRKLHGPGERWTLVPVEETHDVLRLVGGARNNNA